MKLLAISSLLFAAGTALVAAVPAPVAAPAGGLIDLAAWAGGALEGAELRNEGAGAGGVGTMGGWSWTDCGLATDAVQIKEINVNPDPPAPGKNLTVNVKAEVLKTIEEGAWAHVVVKLGLIKLLQKDFDICEEARNANATVQCPIVPGSYDVTQTVELPREIPRAKFAVNVQAYDKEDEDLACVNLFVDFLPHRGSVRG